MSNVTGSEGFPGLGIMDESGALPLEVLSHCIRAWRFTTVRTTTMHVSEYSRAVRLREMVYLRSF